jgi:hypothetical protein
MTKTKQQSVETQIGFADGKVVRIEKEGMKVLVIVQAWNESTIEAEFDEVIGVRESMAFGLSDLVVTDSRSDFINWCAGRAYEDGNRQEESVYQFLDIDGQVCIEILAKGVVIRAR